jgi:hypothetical protein
MYVHFYALTREGLDEAYSNMRYVMPEIAPKFRKVRSEILRYSGSFHSFRLGGSEKEFARAYALGDVVAVRYVRNEANAAVTWTEWGADHNPNQVDRPDVYFGWAALLQCELVELPQEEHEQNLISQVKTVLERTADFAGTYIRGYVRLDFGYLFEVGSSRLVWLLVNQLKSNERVHEWMTVDWLRLTLFLKKHEYYHTLFRREVTKLERVFTEVERGSLNSQQEPERLLILLERSMDECEAIFGNIIASEKGYMNTLDTTIQIGTPPHDVMNKHFLFRILTQVNFSGGESHKMLERLRKRWRGVKRSIHITNTTGRKYIFFWSYLERFTVARYIDCGCSAIVSTLNQVRKSRAKGFGPDSDAVSVAEDIYNWLRDHKNIIYEYQPVQPNRIDQAIREHHEALKAGTCVDLACCYAALLEGAFQRPVLIHYMTLRGPDRHNLDHWEAHMVCGVWVDDNSGDLFFMEECGTICTNVNDFRRYVRDKKLLVVECIGFSKGNKDLEKRLNMNFDESITIARREALGLSAPQIHFNFALDVALCREYGIQRIDQD